MCIITKLELQENQYLFSQSWCSCHVIMTAATKDPTLKQYYETRRVLERPPEKPELLHMMNQKSFEAKRTKRL